jgi:multiple sugar transport system permease protein
LRSGCERHAAGARSEARHNEYLYQYLLLSSTRNMTVAVAIAQFFNSDEAPWNYMMATAIIYAVPPIVIFYALRRYLAADLTRGIVRG